MVAAVGLAAGVTGLAAPMASAAEGGALGVDKLSVTQTLDSLAVGDMPAEDRAQLPRPSQQLNRLNDLNQLQQVTGLVSPLFGAVPALG
jgi:anti-sigma factor RsiW